VYRRFEELPVWQAAIRLAELVYDLTESGTLAGHGAVRDQPERAALSVSNNIAEGWERGTHEELLTFLYYARGSCGEVRSMLRFLSRRHRPGLGHELEHLLNLALDTSGTARGLARIPEELPKPRPALPQRRDPRRRAKSPPAG
jgi:four helix bundle protein